MSDLSIVIPAAAVNGWDQICGTTEFAPQSTIRRHTRSVVPSSGKYRSFETDIVQFFNSLFLRWEEETSFYSDPSRIILHPSFRAMVEYANIFLPLILRELRHGPSLLVWVLEEAYRKQPYPEEKKGDIGAMTRAWLAWANQDEQPD